MALHGSNSVLDNPALERRPRTPRVGAALIFGAFIFLSSPGCGGRGDEAEEDAATPEAASDDLSDETADANPDEAPAESQAADADETAAVECPVDEASVEAAFGIEFEAPELQREENGYSCTFIRADQVGSVAITVSEDGGAAYVGVAATMPDAEPVSDLGEKALYTPGRTALLALADGKMLYMQLVSMIGVDDLRGKAIGLGRQAISRL